MKWGSEFLSRIRLCNLLVINDIQCHVKHPQYWHRKEHHRKSNRACGTRDFGDLGSPTPCTQLMWSYLTLLDSYPKDGRADKPFSATQRGCRGTAQTPPGLPVLPAPTGDAAPGTSPLQQHGRTAELVLGSRALSCPVAGLRGLNSQHARGLTRYVGSEPR